MSDWKMQAREKFWSYRLIRIPLFVGQINIKHKRNSLFSERNGYTPSITIGPIRLTWRRWTWLLNIRSNEDGDEAEALVSAELHHRRRL